MDVFGGGTNKPAIAAEAPADAGAGSDEQPRKRLPQSMRLARFDGNNDELVTKVELENQLKADFAKEDVNSDATLDPVEARALNERLRAEEGTSPVFDWNADGKLVYAEFATQWRTLFDRSDQNRDGVVDDEELRSSGRERKPRELPKPTFSGKDGRPPGSP
jgi:hypothetical protein